jgi:DNA-binding LacI/PurR family transcriptional regulator
MDSVRVTLRDIAKVVGKSHVTVSLALKNHPKISVSTRDYIKKVADSMGYRPDPFLHALASYKKSKNTPPIHAALGWINHLPERQFSKHFETFRLYRVGAEKRADELGYSLDTFHVTDDGISGQALARMLHSRAINGILISPHTHSSVDWDFEAKDICGVSFGYSIRSPRFEIVTNSHVLSVGLCVEKLRALGHQRIALMASRNIHERSAHNFVAGFLGAVLPFSTHDPFPVFFYDAPLKDSNWYEWYEQFRPDAVIMDTSKDAELLLKAGILVPGELSVALINVFPGETFWSGIDQQCELTGRIAVDTVVDLINRRATPNIDYHRHILVQSIWRNGLSTRAC